jgi:hypothetical protein
VLTVVVLLLSYGAVGARQPAVRTAAPLPIPAADLARTLDVSVVDRGRIMLDAVRILFDAPDGFDEGDRTRRQQLTRAIASPDRKQGETIPLPLDPSVWRESILQRPASDSDIIAAILTDRRLALLYHGLAALDDETLAWLGPDRETLQHLLRRPGAFGTFGRSIRVRANRVVVPGGAEAEPLWEAIVGASAQKPGHFVRRLFHNQNGRLAFMYDAMAHLDPPRLRYALALDRGADERQDRLRALANLFESVSPDWRVEDRPFARPQVDPSLSLSLIAVTGDGRLADPAGRELWDAVFRAEEPSSRGPDDERAESETPADAAWLLGRIHRAPQSVSRERLETLLFAQRVLGRTAGSRSSAAAALRAYSRFPALFLALERAGVRSVPVMLAAVDRARTLNEIRDDRAHRTATTAFQSALGIVERAVRAGGLTAADAAAPIEALIALDPSVRDYEARIAQWLQRELLPQLPEREEEVADPVESRVLAAMAGLGPDTRREPVVTWEGRSYRVSAARAELARLRRVRERQGGPSLDTAMASFAALTRSLVNAAFEVDSGDEEHGPLASEAVGEPGAAAAVNGGSLAGTLASILYASSLGDPEGGALVGGNVALRHDFGVSPGLARTTLAWRLPREEFGTAQGWRLSGSLLGLDLALARLAIRRMDSGDMPREPRLTANERQTMFLTAAWMRPGAMSDAARDELAAALGRGRARIDALTADPEAIDRVAHDAGLSEWRREALAWTIQHDRGALHDQFSLTETLWLGAPRMSAALDLDAWGPAQFALTGCPCLNMPAPGDWELLTGRPAVGLLGTRNADVQLRVAELLARLQLPASLAAGTTAFAIQDVVDRAQPAYFGDMLAVSRAVRDITPDRLTDYVAALASAGPLLPESSDDRAR